MAIRIAGRWGVPMAFPVFPSPMSPICRRTSTPWGKAPPRCFPTVEVAPAISSGETEARPEDWQEALSTGGVVCLAMRDDEATGNGSEGALMTHRQALPRRVCPLVLPPCPTHRRGPSQAYGRAGKGAALALAIMLASASAFVGIVFAEQAGIAGLPVLPQALPSLPLLAMLGLCLFLLGC